MKNFLWVLFFALFLVACDSVANDRQEIRNLIETRQTLYEEREAMLLSQQIIMPIYNEYTVSLDINPETGIVTGVLRVNYTNKTGMPLNYIILNVPYNAFSLGSGVAPYFSEFRERIYANTREHGYFNIASLMVNGAPTRFLYQETFLLITLLEGLAEDEAVEITLQFEAYIPHINHRTGASQNAIWLGNFLPTVAVFENGTFRQDSYHPAGEPFYSEIANYSVTITTPSEYHVVSTGNQVVQEQSGIKTTIVDARMVRDFAIVIVDATYRSAFMISENNTDIIFYYHSDIENIDTYLSRVKLALDFFSELIGSYPYEDLTVIETGLFHRGAASYSQIIFIDSELLNSGQNVSTALVQAVSEQWFGSVVGSDNIFASWLSKGLSAFMTEFFFTHNTEVFYRNFVRDHTNFERSMNSSNSYRLVDDLSVYPTWADYQRTQHTKGKLMIFSLYNQMGQDVFIEFLRQYYLEFGFRNATVDDFRELAERVSMQDLSDFFELWLNDVGIPEV